jgi:hypothetical protein
MPLGLAVATIVTSGVAAAKVISACMHSNEITIEAWGMPVDDVQDGPARIVSLSADTGNRNFTLGQQTNDCDARLRTTRTGLSSLLRSSTKQTTKGKTNGSLPKTNEWF